MLEEEDDRSGKKEKEIQLRSISPEGTQKIQLETAWLGVQQYLSQSFYRCEEAL